MGWHFLYAKFIQSIKESDFYEINQTKENAI